MKKLLYVCLIAAASAPSIEAASLDSFLRQYQIDSRLDNRGVLSISSESQLPNLSGAVYEINYILKLLDYYHYSTGVDPSRLLTEIEYRMGNFRAIMSSAWLVQYGRITQQRDKIAFINVLVIDQYNRQIR